MWDKAYKTPDFQTEYGGGITPTFNKDAEGNNILDPDWSPYYNFGPKTDPSITVKDLDGHFRKWAPYDFLSFFQTGGQQDYNVALQGATDRNSIRASFSKNISKGIIPNGAELDRNTYSIRGTQKLGKIFNIDVSASYAQSSNTNPIRQVSNYNPLFRFTYYRANTVDWAYYLNHYTDSVNGGRLQGNNDPNLTSQFLWATFNNNQYSFEDNLRANVDITTNIRPWLTLLTRANLNNYNVRIEKKFLGQDPGYANGYYFLQNSETKSYRFQALLTASRNITSDLTGTLTLGAEKNKDRLGLKVSQNTNGGLSTDAPFYFNLSNSVIQFPLTRVIILQNLLMLFMPSAILPGVIQLP
jgi:iron complex outermembrane receptor protein